MDERFVTECVVGYLFRLQMITLHRPVSMYSFRLQVSRIVLTCALFGIFWVAGAGTGARIAMAQQTGERDAGDRASAVRTGSIGASWISLPQASASQGMIYVDQVGLQFLGNQTIGSDFVDTEVYVLGPQDVLSMTVKGSVSFSVRAAVVNAGGYVSLPFAGDVQLAGRTLAEAEEHLEQAFATEIVDFSLDVSLQQPRPVEVTVSGDVPNPGLLRFPAGTRLDAAIFAAVESEPDTVEADPMISGMQRLMDSEYALRSVRLQREGGKVDAEADLAAFYHTGDTSFNPYLYDGDRVVIVKKNEYTPRVSVSGAVNRPVELEYKAGDTLQDLFDMTGGYLPEADSSMVMRHRGVGAGAGTLGAGTLGAGTASSDSKGVRIELAETDPASIYVKPNDHFVVPRRENVAEVVTMEVRGEVASPGIYPVAASGAGLSDLLAMAGGITPNALPHGAYLVRTLKERNRVSSVFEMDPARLQRTSDSYNEGFAYLDLERGLMEEYRIYIDLTDDQALQGVSVRDGDQLIIPRDDKVVMLYGQVNQPGMLSYQPEKRVEDYIREAAGFTLAADTERIFVIKAAGRTWMKPEDTNIESGDMIFVDRIPYDDFYRYRDFELQTQTQRRANIQLVLSTVTTVASILTTYFAIRSR